MEKLLSSIIGEMSMYKCMIQVCLIAEFIANIFMYDIFIHVGKYITSFLNILFLWHFITFFLQYAIYASSHTYI